MAGGAMTLAELKDLVRSLTFEESSDTGLFTDARLGTFIQIAHRELYNLVATTAPSLLSKVTGDKSVTTSGLDFSGTGVDAQAVHTIVKVEIKDSSSNWLVVPPMQIEEFGNSSGPLATSQGDVANFSWYMEGDTLYLYPQSTTTQTMRVHYVPFPTDITDTETAVAPFGGKLKQFHFIVGYRAADLAMTKDEKNHFHRSYLEMREDLVRAIRRRHVQGSRSVRMLSTED
jgi:hypothetical protein